MNINVITACTRPKNLQQIYKSLNFKFLSWYIVFDSSKVTISDSENFITHFDDIPNIFLLEFNGGVSGNAQRNLALDYIKTGFCYFLDDDNLIHPNFYNKLEYIHNNYNKKIYLFKQEITETSTREINNIGVNQTDQAQYIVDCSLFENLRFEQTYQADGIMIDKLYQLYPHELQKIDEILCYYNRIEGVRK